MVKEDRGVWAFTVTLGENRFERFQIWLDGDSAAGLHPDQSNALKGSPVVGPDHHVLRTSHWIIDGRPPTQLSLGTAWIDTSQAALQDAEHDDDEDAPHDGG